MITPTIGAEIEVQLVGNDSFQLTNLGPEILALCASRHGIKPEFTCGCLEVVSDVCVTAAQVKNDLSHKLSVLKAAAAKLGVSIFGGGTHPFSHWLHQKVWPDERYQRIAEYVSESGLRSVTFGLHVHIGVGHTDRALWVCHRLASYLPALIALSANSPFWRQRNTGLASYRQDLLSFYSTGGPMPYLSTASAYAEAVQRWLDCGLIFDEHNLYWDVRPNRDYGTIEVRVCDMQLSMADVAALAAFIHCLVCCLYEDDSIWQVDEFTNKVNSWNAARFGIAANFVIGGQRHKAKAAISGLLQPLGRWAQHLNCQDELNRINYLCTANGASRQLTVYNETGAFEEVIRRNLL